MRILLDLQALQSDSSRRGIGRYSRNLADAIIKTNAGTEIAALLNSALKEDFEQTRRWAEARLPLDRISVFRGLSSISGISNHEDRAACCATMYEAFVSTLGVDIVHVPSPFEGWGDDATIGGTQIHCGRPAVRAATLHDLIAFEDQVREGYSSLQRSWYDRRYEILKCMDLVLANSEHTAQEAIKSGLPSDRVVVISADADPIFRQMELEPDISLALLNRLGIKKPFVLHVGILEGRKNANALVRAFGLLPERVYSTHELVFVGRTTELQRLSILAIAEQEGLSPEAIVFTGFVNDNQLAHLYSLSRAVVMPSFLEGFGLPLLEAMRCGAPVLGADRTSIPEVIGSRKYLFDPERPNQLAELLSLLLSDSQARANAIEHGLRQQAHFSWTKSAAIAISAFEEALERRRRDVLDGASSFRCVILPPRIRDSSSEAVIHAAKQIPSIEEWSRPKAVPRPKLLAIGGNGIDKEQEDELENIPAIIAIAESQSFIPVSRRGLYRTIGYSGLISADQGSPMQVSVDELTNWPNVLAVARGANDLKAAITRAAGHPAAILADLARCLGKRKPELAAEIAEATAVNHAIATRQPRLFVDVSEFLQRDIRTGIQRVIRNVLRYLLNEPNTYRVEPIHRDHNCYRYARDFTCSFLSLEPLNLPDAVVDFQPHDIFLSLDIDPRITYEAARSLREFRNRGGAVVFVVYDLLPIFHSEWFPPLSRDGFVIWMDRIASVATRIVAISRTSADSVLRYFRVNPPLVGQHIDVTWWHLGSDISGIPEKLAGDTATDAIAAIEDQPIFLTVGTIEPRKGIGQLLDAAEVFWKSGGQAVFVLVGKRGWMVDELIHRILGHKELNKRLFWFEDASDQVLELLYRKTTAVVLPSEGEGFGLPLVEAAHHRKPIIARNLSVFVEVAGNNAFYFATTSAEELAKTLHRWIALNSTGNIPKPDIELFTWRESTEDLYQAVIGKRPYKSWGPS